MELDRAAVEVANSRNGWTAQQRLTEAYRESAKGVGIPDAALFESKRCLKALSKVAEKFGDSES